MILNFFFWLSQRENFTIGRIQTFLLDPNNSDTILSDIELARRAVLYTEFCGSTRIILTFKKESINGDVGATVLVFVASRFNISDVLENNNVVLRFREPSPVYHVLTFCNKSAADHFHSSFRGYFDQNTSVSIPPGLQQFL